MLLKNFYTAIFVPSLNDGESMPVDDGSVNYYRPDGASTSSSVATTTKNLYDSLGFYGMKSNLATARTAGAVVIGTGTTQPTFDDYDLSGSIIKTFTSTVTSTSKTVEEAGITISTTWTITNTSDAAFTIGEVAYFGGYKSAKNYTTVTAMCIERTALEEPVTIEAGGVGQLTYTIRLKYPTT